MIVYFPDNAVIDRPIVLMVPDSEVTDEMRTCFESAHACPWSGGMEMDTLSATFKRGVLYMIDKQRTLRNMKMSGVERTMSAAPKWRSGFTMRPGELTDRFSHDAIKTGHVDYYIESYYIFNAPIERY